MTYLQFHFAYTLPVLLATALVQRRPVAGVGSRVAIAWLGAMVVLAVVYTTPWDNYLVYRDVWGYPPHAVLGTIGYVPVEEYAFFVIQTLFVGLFYFALRGRALVESDSRPMPRSFRTVGLVASLSLTVLGIVMLVHPSAHALYMGLILAWAPPVIAGMWYVGADKVWDERRRVAFSIAVPTLYLWLIDRIAIQRGIWDIRDDYSLQLDPFGLPIEEAVFFLVTTALCVIGLALFLPRTRPILSPT